MSQRGQQSPTFQRARRARGGATPKGGRLPTIGVSPQAAAMERARRRAKRSRALLSGSTEKVGVRNKQKRRAAGKRQRLARARQHRLAKR